MPFFLENLLLFKICVIITSMKNTKNILFLGGFLALIAIIGGVFLFQNNEKNDIVSSQNLQSKEQTDLQKEVPWVELQNTKYGYSLSRPVNMGVIVDGDGTGNGQIETTDGMDISIARMGKPGYEWLNIYVINPEKYPRVKKEFEPDSSLSVILSKAYDANLSVFVNKFRDGNTSNTSPGFETKVSEITNIEIAGQKGYIFTVATTYTGEEKFEYPPTGLPYAYVFLEHNGDAVVLNFVQDNPISQQMLASFRFK